MKSAMTPMFSADPWLNVVSSAGSNESSLRPSKPGPKTMKGELPLQVPRSRVLVVGVVFEEEEEEEEGLVVGFAAAQADAVVVAAVAAAVAVAVAVAAALTAIPADATAALISSAVTSGTRRFCVKMHPSASFGSSPSQTSASEHITY